MTRSITACLLLTAAALSAAAVFGPDGAFSAVALITVVAAFSYAGDRVAASLGKSH